MLFSRPNPSPVELACEWRWTPRPHPGRRSEELLRFREKLAASLRVGHGLGAAFDLRFRSGNGPSLALACRSFAAARWVTRVLAPVYVGSRWIRRPAQGLPIGTGAGLFGRRVRSWPEPLREIEDGPPAAENLLLALSGIPPGVFVRWEFVPWPSSRSCSLDTWTTDLIPTSSHPPPPSHARSRSMGSGEPRTRLPVPLFWEAQLEVGVLSKASSGNDLTSARTAIEAALRSNHGNGVRLSSASWGVRWRKPRFVVSEAELACLLPGIDGPSEVGEPTLAAEPTMILALGRSLAGRVVGPPVEPTQGRHLAILGETGMGKSSALVAIARKAATLGGLVLFDPLGETARSFRAALSPEELRRLLWISPDGPPCGINALEGAHGLGSDPVLADRRLNDLVHALRRVRSGRYADSSFWGPRLEEMLGRALLAAAAISGGTLVDAHTLLATGGRTRQVVPPEAQDDVRSLAERIRERPDDADGARRLLYEVVRSPVLKTLLCERSPVLHPRDLVDEGRIAVISGDASNVGETAARYLLAVYLALLWSELLGRATCTKTFVLLDECQWFSHESLAEMLRLARRKNVHVVLATQTVRSLPEAVADAVWTNVSDFLAFRGSPEEARELARAAQGVSGEEVLALPRGQALLLLGKGSEVHWLRTTGRPPAPDSEAPPRSIAAPQLPAPSLGVPPRPRPPLAVDDALRALRDRARALAPGTRLRVDLAELRDLGADGDRTVRAVGARLGRAGALLATEHAEGRTTWVIEPEKIPLPENGSVRPSAPGATEVPQPS